MHGASTITWREEHIAFVIQIKEDLPVLLLLLATALSHVGIKPAMCLSSKGTWGRVLRILQVCRGQSHQEEPAEAPLQAGEGFAAYGQSVPRPFFLGHSARPESKHSVSSLGQGTHTSTRTKGAHFLEMLKTDLKKKRRGGGEDEPTRNR